MKKIGIIGGLGPESTLDYYKGIIEAFKPTFAETGFPCVVLESVNLLDFINLMKSGSLESVAIELSQAANRLKAAGADFGAIASNTPHVVFDRIIELSDLPLISIVEATSERINDLNLKRVLILGTAFTMRNGLYSAKLKEYGVESFIPGDSDIDYIQDKLFTEIELGVVKLETKKEFIRIVNDGVRLHRVDSVALACTELPLVLKPEDFDAVYVDAAQIHIEAIIKECRSEN